MPLRQPAIVLALCAACIDADSAGDGVIVTIEDAQSQVAPALGVAEDGEEYDLCEYLPPSGPCALLCDREALIAEYVPENVCVVFACELTNGDKIAAHACRPPS